jgi:hypothetical protein
MVIEMLLSNDIQIFFIRLILNFQKEINVIMYITESKKKTQIISIIYEISKFMFL